MLFTEFIEYLPKIQIQQLPAYSAHRIMAPAERVITLLPQDYLKYKPRKSAVMMLVYPKGNNAYLILIKRNTYPGIHSAQISFPGGKAEEYDINLIHTALRETHEEIGVAIDKVEIIMPFTELYIPPSNFLVAPFLGISANTPVFNPSPYEVQELIELSLQTLLDNSTVVKMPMQTSYSKNTIVPAFKVGDHIVWGATAMILSELKETLKMALK